MGSNFLGPDGTDFDDLFEPPANGNGVADASYLRSNGQALQYAPRALGSAAEVTDYARTDGGGDLNTLWAAKGTVAYLANPQTWPSVNYVLAPASSNGVYSPPSGLLMPSVSSVHGTDHMSLYVRIDFYSDGTWWAWVGATNRWDDAWYYYNSIIGTDISQYNPSSGNMTTTFQTGGHGSGYTVQPVPGHQYSGNWLSTPTSGAGANYRISVSFSDVYDYTARASSLTGGTFTYTQGLQGATSGMNILCNGGFVVDGSGAVHSSVSNLSLGSTISVCYGWNSSGGFGGNVGSFQGPDAVLRWVLYTIATIKLSSASGSESVSGTVGLGAMVNWDDYSGDSYVPPKTYTSSDSDSAPWSSATVGAGSQGQWTYGSGSGGGGGGGGGGCVVVEAEMFDGQNAGSYIDGQAILVTDPYGHPGQSYWGQVSYAQAKLQPCVRIRTRQGAILAMSHTAPIPTKDASYVLAPNLKGQSIPAAKRSDIEAYRALHPGDALTDVPFVWDEVMEVEDIGLQWVHHLTVDHEQHCFWATSGGDWFLLHHNLKPIEQAQ